MIKVYCDICGKEVDRLRAIDIPTDIDFVKSASFKANGIFNHTSCTLCTECYNDMQKWYSDGLDKFKTAKQVLFK